MVAARAEADTQQHFRGDDADKFVVRHYLLPLLTSNCVDPLQVHIIPPQGHTASILHFLFTATICLFPEQMSNNSTA